MNLLKAIRRRFIIYDNEKACMNFLANVTGCQILALLQEGMHPSDISKAVQSDATARAYFSGLLYLANDFYKTGDFHYLLVTLGLLLNHVLNHQLIPEKVDFVDLLVQSWNVDRHVMTPQFEKGLDLAIADMNFYRSEGKLSFEGKEIVWEEVPTLAKTTAPAFSFFKLVKANHL